MKKIAIYLPKPYIEMLDDLVEKGFCSHRSEAIRIAIRNLLTEQGKIAEWMQKAKTK